MLSVMQVLMRSSTKVLIDVGRPNDLRKRQDHCQQEATRFIAKQLHGSRAIASHTQ